MNVQKQLHYGEEVPTNPETDQLRKEECLCYHCGKLKPHSDNNCSIAQKLYQVCVSENIAFMMTRCKHFIAK